MVFKKGCENNCELYKGDLQAAKEGPDKNELERRTNAGKQQGGQGWWSDNSWRASK